MYGNLANFVYIFGINFAASLTNAALTIWCGLVTSVTGALVGSRHVDTMAVLAQVVTQLALIHI